MLGVVSYEDEEYLQQSFEQTTDDGEGARFGGRGRAAIERGERRGENNIPIVFGNCIFIYCFTVHVH